MCANTPNLQLHNLNYLPGILNLPEFEDQVRHESHRPQNSLLEGALHGGDVARCVFSSPCLPTTPHHASLKLADIFEHLHQYKVTDVELHQHFALTHRGCFWG